MAENEPLRIKPFSGRLVLFDLQAEALPVQLIVRVLREDPDEDLRSLPHFLGAHILVAAVEMKTQPGIEKETEPDTEMKMQLGA